MLGSVYLASQEKRQAQDWENDTAKIYDNYLHHIMSHGQLK